MAIFFLTFALSGTTDSTTLNVTVPAVLAGDVAFLEYTHRSTGTGTLGGAGGTGWTNKSSNLFATDAFSHHLYWKRFSSDTAAEALTVTGLTNSCAGVVTVYRGCVDTGDPIEAFSEEDNASGDESHAQITTLRNRAWVVLTVANSPDLAIASQTCTSPGALTERAERLNTTGTDTSIAHASAEKASAGATGALTWAQTNGASSSMAYAIKPYIFDDARAAIAAGLNSAQSEGTGFDARLATLVPVSAIVRTSDTVATVTLVADSGYNITAPETITDTMPAVALVGADAVVATPTFTVDTAGAAWVGKPMGSMDVPSRRRPVAVAYR